MPLRITCEREMRTLDEVIAQLRRVQPDLQRRYPIRELGIFGSYVRGEQSEDSDLDTSAYRRPQGPMALPRR